MCRARPSVCAAVRGARPRMREKQPHRTRQQQRHPGGKHQRCMTASHAGGRSRLGDRRRVERAAAVRLEAKRRRARRSVCVALAAAIRGAPCGSHHATDPCGVQGGLLDETQQQTIAASAAQGKKSSERAARFFERRGRASVAPIPNQNATFHHPRARWLCKRARADRPAAQPHIGSPILAQR